MVSVIEIVFLYMYCSALICVLLRPKKVQLPTKSAENRICIGKWAFEMLAIYLLEDKRAPNDQTFLAYLVQTLL